MKAIFRVTFAILVTLAFVTLYWISLPWSHEQRPKSTPNDEILVYNKVSKSGSSAFIAIAKYLSKRHNNNFTVSQHPGIMGSETFKKKMSEVQLAEESHVIATLPRPVLYARHVYYIDLSEYGFKKPMYINLIRDPVDRFVSNFYYQQVGSVGQNRSSPGRIRNINECVLEKQPLCSSGYYVRLYMTRYFCGQDDACGADERETVEIAKRNIEKDYIFIGLTEEFENSLRLFENILPNFFHGAVNAWRYLQSGLQRYETVKKETISAKARKVLKKQMWADYEIYRFVQDRFEKAKLHYGVV